MRRLTDPLFAWLGAHQVAEPGYDQGGIRDPLDGRVAGAHYATTHFAWLCALRHRAAPDPALLGAARRAIAFHLRTSPGEYGPDEWSYHWDFNNLAFIETFSLLAGELDAAERREWIQGLKTWKTNAHWAANWVAMRACAHFRRFELFGRPDDATAAGDWLEYVLSRQGKDGSLFDVAGKSLPSQYHAYTACLLHRICAAGGPARRNMRTMAAYRPFAAKAVREAAGWLLAITAPDGEMNALGRGQGQVFGLACAVYLFRAAALLDEELAPRYRFAERAVLSRLERFQSDEGWWPLTLNIRPTAERAGWYDYHHLSVYNAFAGVWLTLAAGLPAGSREESPPMGVVRLKDSGTLVARTPRFFALFCAGHEGAGYRTEAGITPHQLLWEGCDVFRYPLGPGTGKYGERARNAGQEVNLWAPVWRAARGGWRVPAGAAGSVSRAPDIGGWRLRFAGDGTLWQRDLVIGRRFLEARDTMELPAKAQNLPGLEVRAQNVAFGEARPHFAGRSFVRKNGGGATLAVWGGSALEEAGTVRSAWGESHILASWAEASGGTVRSGWRLRQEMSDLPGKLPGIVCLSWDPWSGLWKRKQRLAFELARSGRSPGTLFIEPPVTLAHVVENPQTDKARHLRALCGGVTDMGHNLRVATPLLPWPGGRSVPRLARANRRAWLRGLARHVRKADFPEGYVLWLYHPSQLDALDALGFGAELVVYDWTDDWVQALPADRPQHERDALKKRQKELLQRADVVFAVSRELARRAAACCPHVLYLPNATDPGVFKPFDGARPHPLARRKPLLVYLSQITERLDAGLVGEVARLRPQWTIALVGPVVCGSSHVAGLSGLDNVILTGPLPYREAASLAAQADVCVLPHVENALTRTLDPIKLYDYLATGRPIVSTDVAMHPDLALHARVASGAADFALAVEAALREPAQGRFQRIEAAKAHTWRARALLAADVLEHFFPPDGK